MSRLPKAIEELNEPSEYLKEVLETPPAWAIRWGEVFVLVIVLLFFLLSYLIRYPDRIPAQAIITTVQPPIPVNAQTEGALAQLLVKDQDQVTKGEVLAVVQSAAVYDDVIHLKEQLQRFNITLFHDSLRFTASYHLGRLQENYAQLQKAAQAYHLFQKLTPAYRQQQAILGQLSRYQRLLVQKQEQQQILERKVQLAEKDYRRNQQLHATQTIADKDLEASEGQWLAAQEANEILRSERAQLSVQIAELKREQSQFGTQHTQEGEELRTTLLSSLDQLGADIRQWEENYLLIAPRSGQVAFSDFWTEQQSVKAGQTVMRIIPPTDKVNGSIIGQLRVPTQNSGKLKKGQQVEVYLDNYPHAEYGTLSAKVQSISALPKQGQYLLTITFPDGLVTQYNQVIPFQQQLQGRAEIITEDLRLLERFIYQLRSVNATFAK
ncbi:MAG: HlyD family efflux transporter periplasmic adaptor subunit [Bacteroidota bacterium]